MMTPDGAVVFVLGGPGSGKGTQCARLIERYGAAHFSAGDLLRAEVKSGSEKGKMIDDMIKEGRIVPAQVTIDLLKAAMASRKGPYLIDGFPRSLDNLQGFEEQVAGGCALTLFYDVSEAVMEGRLLKRGETSGRSDDNAATIKKRFNTFREQSVPVVELLRGRGLVATVDASRSPDDVFEATCKSMDKVAEPINVMTPDGAVVFVLGGPGSGKGTQCARLIERYGAAHFSAGDLLRAEVKSGSEQGKMIGDMIKEGRIVPAQVTIDLLKAAMASRKGPYLIDGFPRSLDNLQGFEEQVAGGCALTLFYDVSEAVMEGRLLKRGETSGRSDDNAATIKKRFNTFREQSVPVVELLRGRGLVATVDASRSPDDVFEATCKSMDKVAVAKPMDSAQVQAYVAKHDLTAKLQAALNHAIAAQSPDPLQLIAAALTPPGPPRPASAVGTFLRVITVNDVYDLENYPRVASAVLAAKRAADALDCVAVSTLQGDFLSPCPITALDGGRAMTEGLNVGQIDYVCLGNHELDYGFELPAARMEAFNGKLINSNVSSAPLDGFPQYELISVGKRRVVLTGLLSSDTSIYAPSNVPAVEPPAEAAARVWEAAMAALGATPDLHLPMTHALIPEDKAFCNALAKHAELGARTPVVLGGHEHEVYIDSAAGSTIVKTGQDAARIGVVDVWWAADGSVHSSATVLPATEFGEEPKAKAFVLEKRAFLQRVMSAPIAQVPAPMTSKTVRHEPSALASFLLSYVQRGLAADGCELAMVQGGFVRAGKDYEAGAFTMGDLFAEFAFEGAMALVPLKGSIIQQATVNTRTAPKPAPNFLHFDSGVVLDAEHTILTVGGKPFEPERVYSVAIYQLLLTGLNVIEPLMSYVREHVTVPDAEACRLCKEIVLERAMKDEWRRLVGFDAFDADGDGKVSRRELRAGIDAFISSIDKNGDGKISTEEVAALIQSKHGHLSVLEQLVKTLDANGDGIISKEELLALAV